MSNFVKYYLSKYLKVFLSDYKSNEMKIDLIKGKVKMQNVGTPLFFLVFLPHFTFFSFTFLSCFFFNFFLSFPLYLLLIF